MYAPIAGKQWLLPTETAQSLTADVSGSALPLNLPCSNCPACRK